MFKIILSLAVGVWLAVQPPRSGERSAAENDRPRTESGAVAADAGVVISSQELMDMLYANDPDAPLHPNEDGSIPLTRALLKQFMLHPFEAGGPAGLEETDEPELDEGIVTARLTPDQVIELLTTGQTPVETRGPKQVHVPHLFAGGLRIGPGGKLAMGGPQYARMSGDAQADAREAPDEDDEPSATLALNCAFRIRCDENGENCKLTCGGNCPINERCARVTRTLPGGGSETTCECVPDPR